VTQKTAPRPANPAVAGLLDPQRVIMVGASARETRIGGTIPSALRRFGFAGEVIPVNPSHAEIMGWPAVAAVSDVPPNPFGHRAVAIINRPAGEAVAHLRSLADLGYECFVILASGFAEVGGEGVGHQDELRREAQDRGLVVIGPNCPGVAHFASGFVAFGTTNFRKLTTFRTGGVAIVTASGGLGNTIFSFVQERGLGCHSLVGVGNEAVTHAGELLHHYADDPSCEMVLAYIEQIRDMDSFTSGVQRLLASGKRLAMIKAGRNATGALLLRSHTGAIAGNGAMARDLLTDLGVVVVDDPEELADAAMLLRAGVRGRRQGILSLPGGGKALLADAAQEQGLSVPPLPDHLIAELRSVIPDLGSIENPLDPSAELTDPQRIAGVLEMLANSGGFDTVVFFPLNSDPELARNIAAAAAGRMLDQNWRSPMVVIWTATSVLQDGAWRVLREAQIPLFTNIANAFRAMGRVASVLGRGGPAEPATVEDARSELGRSGLGRAGLGQPADLVARLAADPMAALAELGFPTPRRVTRSLADRAGPPPGLSWPVVVKAEHGLLPHRMKAGGVRLGVSGADQLRATMEGIREDVARSTGLDVTEFEIQEQQPAGLEWIVSTTCDPEIGRVLTVGMGGIFVEAYGDVIHGIPTLDREALARRVGRTKVAAAVARLGDGAAVAALVEVAARMSAVAALLADAGSTGTLELNPVIVDPGTGRAVVVDALWLDAGKGA
jgi:acyl-CoA synthetase (NDP forming)